MKFIKAKVSFKGPFPADMLRHDMAFPLDTISANTIVRSGDPDELDRWERKDVWIGSMKARKSDYLTLDRWASFGAIVTDIEEIDLWHDGTP